MNGSIPRVRGRLLRKLPEPFETIQMLPNEEIAVRQDPAFRLPRQIEHISRLVDHILTVKDTPQLRFSLAAHFDRLSAYRRAFLKAGPPIVRKAGQSEKVD
jgi:hypothetical protein